MSCLKKGVAGSRNKGDSSLLPLLYLSNITHWKTLSINKYNKKLIKLPSQVCGRYTSLYRRNVPGQTADYFLPESPCSDLLLASGCLMTPHSEAMLNSAEYKPKLQWLREQYPWVLEHISFWSKFFHASFIGSVQTLCLRCRELWTAINLWFRMVDCFPNLADRLYPCTIGEQVRVHHMTTVYIVGVTFINEMNIS